MYTEFGPLLWKRKKHLYDRFQKGLYWATELNWLNIKYVTIKQVLIFQKRQIQ